MELAKTLSVSSLKVRYFAFNALEIKMPDGKTLVVDPCLEKEGHFSCGYDVDDLEGCDYVFLNHSHGDHAASLGKLYDKYHPLIMAASPADGLGCPGRPEGSSDRHGAGYREGAGHGIQAGL